MLGAAFNQCGTRSRSQERDQLPDQLDRVFVFACTCFAIQLVRKPEVFLLPQRLLPRYRAPTLESGFGSRR
jgi:hypothetical protein